MMSHLRKAPPSPNSAWPPPAPPRALPGARSDTFYCVRPESLPLTTLTVYPWKNGDEARVEVNNNLAPSLHCLWSTFCFISSFKKKQKQKNKRSRVDLFSKRLIKWGFEKGIVRNPEDPSHRRGCPHAEWNALSRLKKHQVINQNHPSVYVFFTTVYIVYPAPTVGLLKATQRDKQLSSDQLTENRWIDG